MEEDLLESEREVLKKAQEIINSQEYENELLFKKFKKLATAYQKMLIQFDKILKIGDNQQELLLRRKQQFEDMSFIDGLTGVANRRRFDEMLEENWNLARRKNRSLVLIMLDIDFFKEFNDTYGHLIGDDCLIKIATLLNEEVKRSTEHVARYGGEEFVIVSTVKSREDAKKFAERIRNEVEKLKIEHKQSTVSKYVTVSLGLAVGVPTDKYTPEELIDIADNALYQAKEAGRNRLEVIDLNIKEGDFDGT